MTSGPKGTQRRNIETARKDMTRTTSLRIANGETLKPKEED